MSAPNNRRVNNPYASQGLPNPPISVEPTPPGQQSQRRYRVKNPNRKPQSIGGKYIPLDLNTLWVCKDPDGGDEWQFDHEDITEAIEEGSKWSINGNGVGYPKAMEYRHGTPVTNLAFEGVAGINWVFEYPILKEGVYDYKARGNPGPFRVIWYEPDIYTALFRGMTTKENRRAVPAVNRTPKMNYSGVVESWHDSQEYQGTTLRHVQQFNPAIAPFLSGTWLQGKDKMLNPTVVPFVPRSQEKE